MSELTSKKTGRRSRAVTTPQDYLSRRSDALTRLRFQAGDLETAKAALLDILAANLGRAGFAGQQPELQVSYNPYSPSANGWGFLQASVKMDWTKLQGKGYFRERELLEGIPQPRFGGDSGRPLFQKEAGSALTFSVPLEADGEEQGLVMLATTIAHERALAKALETLRSAQESRGVQGALQGTGADQAMLREELDLQRQVADLEDQLQAKREELRGATRKADEVRKRLRETETPASEAVRKELNAVRDKLGMKRA